MIMKKHRLCLDNCGVQPKHIIDMVVQGQHDLHDQQTIDQIYNRILDADNQKIVDEFLLHCTLDSLLAENESRKQTIQKKFEQFLNDFFKDITSLLTTNWKENQRIIRTLCSISPLYNQDSLAQIQGEFSFLKEKNIKSLEILTNEQKVRNKDAKSKIDDIMQQTENFMTQTQSMDKSMEKSFKPIRQPQQIPDQPQQMKTQQQGASQVIQQIQMNPNEPKKTVQWDSDGKQKDRLNKVKSKQVFAFSFEKERGLQIKKQKFGAASQDDMQQMLDLCVEFQPVSMGINLMFYLINTKRSTGVKEISPLSSMKALVNLQALNINLQGNAIQNISSLSSIKALINLNNLDINLQYNGISDISPISDLKDLIYLSSLKIDLYGNKVTNISPLSAFKTLTNLTCLDIDLGKNGFKDISPLRALRALVNLISLKIDLGENGLVDISSLNAFKDLINLTNLDIDLHGHNLAKDSVRRFTSYQQLIGYFK